MEKKNSNLWKAKEILYNKAIIKSHVEYGKTPSDLDFKKNDISRIDIGAELGRLSVKCFYRSSKKCFYYDISEKHIDRWVSIIKELYEYDDFDEVSSEEPTSKEVHNAKGGSIFSDKENEEKAEW